MPIALSELGGVRVSHGRLSVERRRRQDQAIHTQGESHERGGAAHGSEITER
jgi:hypothetical protein